MAFYRRAFLLAAEDVGKAGEKCQEMFDKGCK